MFLTKDGITIEVFHPTEIASYKKLGFVEEKDNPNVPEVKEPVAEVAPEPEPDQQAKDQATVEKALQPTKKGKGKS